MTLLSTSIAAANAATARNVSFSTPGDNLERKAVIIATYDPAKTLVVPDVPVEIADSTDAGSRFGFGFAAHRFAYAFEKGGPGVRMIVIPVEEEVGAVAATGTFTITGTATENGTLPLYIGGERIAVAVATGDLAADVSDNAKTAADLIVELPTTQLSAAGVLTPLAKSKGTYGNGIPLKVAVKAGEAVPAGLTVVVVDMASGATNPDISDALASLGSGMSQNGDYMTELLQGFGHDTTVLDDLSVWNGEGNVVQGNYDRLVGRPVRSLNGNNTAGSAGFTEATTAADLRKLDRTSGTIACPGTPMHADEVAAVIMGMGAQENANRGGGNLIGALVPWAIPGEPDDRWTDDYTPRDTALKKGVASLAVENGAYVAQNVATYYHPDGVPITKNGYRSYFSISKVQNMLNTNRAVWAAEKWIQIIIVDDVTAVRSKADREKVRSIESVEAELLGLADIYAAKAWIFSKAFTIAAIQAGGLVVIRDGGTGFDMDLPVILSAEGGIFNNEVQFDVSLGAVLS